jgi:hypothetical protein
MNWYYVEADTKRQVGPIDGDEFVALISSGKITPGTLVWREGMAHWHPLVEAIGRRRCRRRRHHPRHHRSLLERLLSPGTIQRHRRHPVFPEPPSEGQRTSLLRPALILAVYATFVIALGAGMWHAVTHPHPGNRSPLMHYLVEILKGE